MADFWDVAGAIGGPVVSGITSLLGIGSGSSSALKQARETNETNLKIAQMNNAAQENLWKKQSEYNTPYNQMQRYLEAGLNPNLMASSGQVNSGNASNPPAFHTPTMQAYTGELQAANARAGVLRDMVQNTINNVRTLKDIELRDSEIQKNNAQAEQFLAMVRNLNWDNMFKADTITHRINRFRYNTESDYYNAAWLADRNKASGKHNYWDDMFNLAYYNSQLAGERWQRQVKENAVFSMYGMEQALANLNLTKSSTERNKILGRVQSYLAPFTARSLASLANLRDEQTIGTVLGNGLAAYNYQDRATGGDFGFKFGGSNFTLGGLMRAVFGLGKNAVNMFTGKPISYY